MKKLIKPEKLIELMCNSKLNDGFSRMPKRASKIVCDAAEKDVLSEPEFEVYGLADYVYVVQPYGEWVAKESDFSRVYKEYDGAYRDTHFINVATRWNELAGEAE